MARTFIRMAVVGAVLGATALSFTPPLSAAPVPPAKVALFFNGTYVDTVQEANNTKVTLEANSTVTTFTGITAGDFTAALADADILVIPEFDTAPLLPDLSTAAQTVIANWVEAGGRLIMQDPGSNDAVGLANSVFGFTMTSDGSCPCDKTAAATGTEFAAGSSTIPGPSATDGLVISSLPAGSKSIYTDQASPSSGLVVIPAGKGALVFFGWDWFEAPPQGSQDGGWLALLQDAAVMPVATVADTTSVAGSAATFTISVSGVSSQDVVVTYETADGTATAGTGYTATSGSIVIPAGGSKTVSVPTTAAAAGKTLQLKIAAPYYGVVGVAATGTAAMSAGTTPSTTPPAAPVAAAPQFTG
jgi:hypothetical protein